MKNAVGMHLKEAIVSAIKGEKEDDQQVIDLRSGPNDKLASVQKLLRTCDKDNFLVRRSPAAIIAGTFIMWMTMAMAASGLQITSRESIRSTLAFLNTLLAGTGGALGTHIAIKLLKLFKLKKEKRKMRTVNYFDIGEDADDYWSQLYKTKMGYFFNLDSEIEIFNVLRGIIAGAISIQINASSFKPWTAFVNGLVSGGIYMYMCRVYHYAEVIDDVTHVSTIHMIIGAYSAISIAIFHSKEGLLTKNLLTHPGEGNPRMIALMGSNTFGLLIVFLLIALGTMFIFRVVFA